MAWLLRNLKFPECPVGTPLGHIEEINDKEYVYVAPNGERTPLHLHISDPTYRDSALLEGVHVPITKSLYQRPKYQRPTPAKKLPEVDGEYRQGPIADPTRLFETLPQVNLDALTTAAATTAVLQYVQANPKSTLKDLQKRFHCSTQRMLAMLENPDLVTRTHVGPMRVYSLTN